MPSRYLRTSVYPRAASRSATRWLFGQDGLEQYVTIAAALSGNSSAARAATSAATSAAAAGVGKGTLFRRFGDKAGLAVALLDERERVLQAAILSGPPPLGPEAPPTERLRAFVDAYLDYAFAHLDLIRMSERGSPGARY